MEIMGFQKDLSRMESEMEQQRRIIKKKESIETRLSICEAEKYKFMKQKESLSFQLEREKQKQRELSVTIAKLMEETRENQQEEAKEEEMVNNPEPEILIVSEESVVSRKGSFVAEKVLYGQIQELEKKLKEQEDQLAIQKKYEEELEKLVKERDEFIIDLKEECFTLKAMQAVNEGANDRRNSIKRGQKGNGNPEELKKNERSENSLEEAYRENPQIFIRKRAETHGPKRKELVVGNPRKSEANRLGNTFNSEFGSRGDFGNFVSFGNEDENGSIIRGDQEESAARESFRENHEKPKEDPEIPENTGCQGERKVTDPDSVNSGNSKENPFRSKSINANEFKELEVSEYSEGEFGEGSLNSSFKSSNRFPPAPAQEVVSDDEALPKFGSGSANEKIDLPNESNRKEENEEQHNSGSKKSFGSKGSGNSEPFQVGRPKSESVQSKSSQKSRILSILEGSHKHTGGRKGSSAFSDENTSPKSTDGLSKPLVINTEINLRPPPIIAPALAPSPRSLGKIKQRISVPNKVSEQFCPESHSQVPHPPMTSIQNFLEPNLKEPEPQPVTQLLGANSLKGKDFVNFRSSQIIEKLLVSLEDPTSPEETFSDLVFVYETSKKKKEFYLMVTLNSIYVLNLKFFIVRKLPIEKLAAIKVADRSATICCLQSEESFELILETFHRIDLALFLFAAKKKKSDFPALIFKYYREFSFSHPNSNIFIDLKAPEQHPETQHVFQGSPYAGELFISATSLIGFQSWKSSFCVLSSVAIIAMKRPEVLL